MTEPAPSALKALDVAHPIWERVFTVAPLTLVGAREADGRYSLAPKHMAMPMGWDNYFGFVCTPRHRTYQNVKREKAFSVSYPRPDQVTLASLTAVARAEDGSKPLNETLPLFTFEGCEGRFLKGGYLYLSCQLDRVIDGFGQNSLIVGRIVNAWAHREALRVSEGDDAEVIGRSPLLAYLYPTRFARIEQSVAFPFPAAFKR